MIPVHYEFVLYRFILHSDRSNPYLETLEDLEREMDVFDPSVLVVGGLQMMDNFHFEDGKQRFSSFTVNCAERQFEI